MTNDGENDLDEVQYTFATGEQLGIIMAAGQPQDYTYGDGENNRTAADLAQQYARAVSYESVWPLYPVLSGEEQQGLVRQMLYLAGYSEEEMENENAVWYSKYGASSPSFRNYVIVPGKDENTCIAVFQMYGGGVTDGRTAANITVGKENGRVAITGWRNSNMTAAWDISSPRSAGKASPKRRASCSGCCMVPACPGRIWNTATAGKL